MINRRNFLQGLAAATAAVLPVGAAISKTNDPEGQVASGYGTYEFDTPVDEVEGLGTCDCEVFSDSYPEPEPEPTWECCCPAVEVEFCPAGTCDWMVVPYVCTAGEYCNSDSDYGWEVVFFDDEGFFPVIDDLGTLRITLYPQDATQQTRTMMLHGRATVTRVSPYGAMNSVREMKLTMTNAEPIVV